MGTWIDQSALSSLPMDESAVYTFLLRLSFILAIVTFITLFFFNAPYGRHVQRRWGATLPNHLGWLVMEAPAALLFAAYFAFGRPTRGLPEIVFLVMWEAHYLHRAFIYPFQISDGRKKMPLVIVGMALIFNAGNAYLNGYYIFHLSGGYPPDWLVDPRFFCGLALFASGYALNRCSDRRLRLLRAPGETGYKIPHGGFFNWVSCPNYLGEIIEWGGWAMATWSLAGLSFAVWTFANLAPRARAHHAWYQANFPDYPTERKALIPGIW
jgi:protein-S-isoprenylcysteine O-methyltransferase Ste14